MKIKKNKKTIYSRSTRMRNISALIKVNLGGNVDLITQRSDPITCPYFKDLTGLNAYGTFYDEDNPPSFKCGSLKNANFTNAQFDCSVDFRGANLIDAVFRNAKFKNADFSGAILLNTDFTNANFGYFRGAIFPNADFRNAKITNTIFTKAIFGYSPSDFTGARFNNADFTGATFFSSPIFKYTIFNGDICPPGAICTDVDDDN